MPSRRPPRAIPDQPRAALAHLSAADPIMGRAIAEVGRFGLKRREPSLHLLCSSIIGQSISVKAAESVVARFTATFGAADRLEPRHLMKATPESIRAVGVTRAKAEAMRGVAELWHSERWTSASVVDLDDEHLAERLTSVRGIGPWTVTMFQIFGLRRPDILPWGDLGVRVGIQKLYGLEERPDRATVERIGAPWAPWRTVGTVYVWQWLMRQSGMEFSGDDGWW